jgi:hypothetical protein
VPVAVNCCLLPFATEALAGVMATETRAGGATVSVVELLTEFEVTEILVEPCLRVATFPALTEATVASEEDHVAVAERSCVVLSVKVPVATSCWVKPSAREGLAGVTAIEVNVAAVIVTAVVPLIVTPETESAADAEIVELPVAKAETIPLLTLATLALEELQVADAVKSFVVPSE